MAAEPVIVVKDLHKQFVLPQHKNTSVKQAFVNIGRRNSKKKQVVLDGISFSINKGDFFGIVGRNGSGKSTLLKILAGVYSPTAGSVQINGALTPFIELGVGFNPELSGRDNVYLNGALLGFSHKEMDDMYQDIVSFAELGGFMDQKLKNYSSGMQVRLAFSIAVKAHNDILIFDEVLAVGDEAFQRKCLNVFEQHKANKQTVVLVTHDMGTVREFCNRAILIADGKIVEMGDPRKVANTYSELNQEEVDRETVQKNKTAVSEVLHVSLTDAAGRKKESFHVGETMRVRLSWSDLDASKIESVGIHIFKQSGEHVTGINSRTGGLPRNWRSLGGVELEFDLNLTKGIYRIIPEVFSEPGKVMATLPEGVQFSVVHPDAMEWSGLTELAHNWKIYTS